MGIKPIDLDTFINKAKNIHEAIVAASQRARQVNNDLRIEFNQRVELFSAKAESETEENDINPDQLKVSLEFEKRPKPTDTALEELLGGKLDWRYKETEQVLPPNEEDEG